MLPLFAEEGRGIGEGGAVVGGGVVGFVVCVCGRGGGAVNTVGETAPGEAVEEV